VYCTYIWERKHVKVLCHQHVVLCWLLACRASREHVSGFRLRGPDQVGLRCRVLQRAGDLHPHSEEAPRHVLLPGSRHRLLSGQPFTALSSAPDCSQVSPWCWQGKHTIVIVCCNSQLLISPALASFMSESDVISWGDGATATRPVENFPTIIINKATFPSRTQKLTKRLLKLGGWPTAPVELSCGPVPPRWSLARQERNDFG